MEISVERLNEIVERASAYGAFIAMRDSGVGVQEYCTREELKSIFGAGRINTLLKEGKITPHRFVDGGRTLYAKSDVYKLII
jgi:hypothetical protein